MTRGEALDRLDELERELEDLAGQVRALHRGRQTAFERIEDLEEGNADLRERLPRHEGEVTPNPSAKPYQAKTRDERVREVRIALGRKARQQGGKTSMTYTDVLALFGNHPSRGPSYKLMELAANLDGFDYDQGGGDQIRLLVNLGAVNDDAVLHAVKPTQTPHEL